MSRMLAGLGLAALMCACNWKSQPAAPRGSSDVLTRQEIAATEVDNAYDAVQRLRPEFLRERSTGIDRRERPAVFINGVRRGSVEMLRTVAVSTISEIRYLTAPEAAARYGLDVSAGVIEVTIITQ